MKIVELANARCQLSELIDCVARGESIVISKRGRHVARLIGVEAQRQTVDAARLRALTDAMPMARQEAGVVMRQARDAERY